MRLDDTQTRRHAEMQTRRDAKRRWLFFAEARSQSAAARQSGTLLSGCRQRTAKTTTGPWPRCRGSMGEQRPCGGCSLAVCAVSAVWLAPPGGCRACFAAPACVSVPCAHPSRCASAHACWLLQIMYNNSRRILFFCAQHAFGCPAQSAVPCTHAAHTLHTRSQTRGTGQQKERQTSTTTITTNRSSSSSSKQQRHRQQQYTL